MSKASVNGSSKGERGIHFMINANKNVNNSYHKIINVCINKDNVINRYALSYG